MGLVDTVDDKKLEDAAQIFADMIDNKEYKEALEIYRTCLTDEERRFIRCNKKYHTLYRVATFSSQ